MGGYGQTPYFQILWDFESVSFGQPTWVEGVGVCVFCVVGFGFRDNMKCNSTVQGLCIFIG